MIFLSWLMAAVALWLLLPTLSDLISLVVLLLRRVVDRRNGDRAPLEQGRFLFLVPAHDEELGIRTCVSSLLNMDYPEDLCTVVVIADNCTDDTAASAEAAGATVMVRTDHELRGKPRALEWAIERLPLEEYDAVVVIDADVFVDPGLARHLAAKGSWSGRAGQVYDGVSNPTENALTRMAVVFSNLRYHLSFPLKEAVGLNVPLQGNGMVFGADLLARRGWDAFSICEDWEIYTLLSLEGVETVGCPEGRALAQEATSLGQSNSQRKRWAAGKITVLMQYAGPILRARMGLRQKLDLMAELTHLGPAAHLGLAVLLSGLVILLRLPGTSLLLAALWIPILRIGLYTLLALRFEERPLRTLASFLYLPFYAAWRVVIQITSLSMLGDKPWVRTQRSA
jgi:cellulose synthase/poly-beta-1,6-N-acetylglucosamine synthase-like glycosyltransferase